MTQPIKTRSLARLAIGALAGTLAVAILASIAWAAGNASFAHGIVWGGAIGISGTITLILMARRRGAPAEARLAAGQADEREQRLATRAGAFAGVAMYAAAVVMAVVTAVWNTGAEASLAIIMFTGLLTAAGTFTVSVRRG